MTEAEPRGAVAGEITDLLHAHCAGDPDAMEALMPKVYEALRDIAHRRLGREAKSPLHTTDLVHEAFLRLVDQTRTDWKSRAHFYAIASMVMRRILVNDAKARLRAKRGGGAVETGVTTLTSPASGAIDLLELEDALQSLAVRDARACEVVVCRFFGGLDIEETAVALDISATTVKRSWRLAKAWLRRELE